MTVRRRWLVTVLLMVLAVPSAAEDPGTAALPTGVDAGLAAISADGVESHMRFLADDLLEGRKPGTRGHRLAALYFATRLEAVGFEPAGANGWRQPVPLRRVRVEAKRSSLQLERRGRKASLKAGRDYAVLPRTRAPRLDVSGDVAFVGFGVHAPGLGHDDYADIDVRGRVVAMLAGAPNRLRPDVRAHLGSEQEKLRTAEAFGAVGLLFVHDPAMQSPGHVTRVARAARSGSLTWVDPNVRQPGHDVDGIVVLGEKASRWLFDGTGMTLEQAAQRTREGERVLVALAAEAGIRTDVVQTAIEGANVLGLLPGSDPDLASQTVALTCHIDHLGAVQKKKGDGIYNGALDNASGIAAVLEIARAFGALAQRPRRSVLILGATAEESGLLGSDYFVQRPPAAVSDVVGAINIDLVPMLYPVVTVVAHGERHSSLAAPLATAAAHLGIGIEPDPWPNQSMFVRSDQYSFVRRGVPALFLAPGFTTGDPELDGREIWQSWMRETYHTPADDLSQDLDYEAAAQVARLGFLTSLLVAEADERPRWNLDSLFAERP